MTSTTTTPESATTAVALSGVTKVYGRGANAVLALDGVSLDVAPGEFVCLVGASGCGKSTLLNLVAGLDRVSGGQIGLAGGASPGLMFQEPALFPWLTVEANVEVPLKLRGMPRAERRARVAELLRTVHLNDFGRKRPHELSGGMRQRVALARTLALDTPVLLMDEPFGALDAMTRDILHDELERIWSERKLSVLFVTHNVREAARLADRIILLSSRPGRIIYSTEVHIPRPRRIDSPRSPPSPPTSPNGSVRRWAAMASDTLTSTARADAEISGLDALEIAGRDKELSRATRIWAATWPKLAALAIAILAWQIVVWSGWKPPYSLPGPLTVGRELVAQAQGPQLWEGLLTTLRRAAVGYVFSVAVGLLLGLAVARSTVLRAAIGSMITALQTMPSIAWFPLAILLFELSEKAIFFVVVLGAAPSIANGVISGVDYVPPLLLRAGRNLGARGINLYRYVIAPAALPAIVAGLKQGWAFSWRSLMAGELIVVGISQTSLGAQLTYSRELSDAPWLLSTMIVILVLGLVVDAAFGAADKAIRRRWGVLDQAGQ
ncbi:hypothetical protein GCM10027614_60520 [Micromonospora vulcania]